KRAQQQHNRQLHSGRPPSVCDQCGKSFPHKSALKDNIQRVHEDVGEQQCTFGCGRKFQTLKKRERHETERHIIKNCVCGKECEGSLSLLEHRKQCAEAKAKVPTEHRCPHCREEFPQRYELTVHMRLYHNKVQCDICDEYFDGDLEKEKHKRKYHKE
ncbi:zinc finger protein 271-like protein, partial [Leptotrombidium deliense]